MASRPMNQPTSQRTDRPPIVSTPGPGGRGRARIEKARDVRGTTRRLLVYLLPYRWALVGVFILVIVSSILNLLGPYLISVAIDQHIAIGDVDGLLRIVVLMAGAYLVAWLALTAQNTIMAVAAQRAMRTLRRDLFEHLQTLSLRFFDRHPHGELMSRLTNDIDTVNRVLSQNVTQLFGGLLSLGGIVVMMFAINFWLALASMLVLPLMLGLVGFVGKRTRGGYRILQAKDLLRRTSDNIKTVARRVGFTDPAYFSRVFRKVMGTSPSAYREHPE